MLYFTLEMINQRFAVIEIFAIVVVDDVKRSSRVGRRISGGCPNNINTGERGILAERGLCLKFGGIAVVEDGNSVSIRNELLGKVQAEESVASSLGVDDQSGVIADRQGNATGGLRAHAGCRGNSGATEKGGTCSRHRRGSE